MLGNKVVSYDSILQKDEPVSQGVLVSKIGTDRVLFAELNHGLIDDYSSACPECFCENLHDIVEPCGNFSLRNHSLLKMVADNVSNCGPHSIQCRIEAEAHGIMNDCHQGTPQPF